MVHQRDKSEDRRRDTWPPTGCRPCCQRSLFQPHRNLAFQHAALAPPATGCQRRLCPRASCWQS
eukprot:5707262-Prymnesium_polylepis.1